MQNSTSSDNIVDHLFHEHLSLVEFLANSGEISLRYNVEDNFRKTLLVAGASYIEANLSDRLIRLFAETTNAPEPLVEFFRNKAIARQYHTFFNWDGRNANAFFGLFGTRFREFMGERVSGDSNLDSCIRAFLELGSLRNQLVHQNFSIFPLEKTVDEIYDLYQRALIFVEEFQNAFGEFIQGLPNIDSA